MAGHPGSAAVPVNTEVYLRRLTPDYSLKQLAVPSETLPPVRKLSKMRWRNGLVQQDGKDKELVADLGNLSADVPQRRRRACARASYSDQPELSIRAVLPFTPSKLR